MLKLRAVFVIFLAVLTLCACVKQSAPPSAPQTVPLKEQTHGGYPIEQIKQANSCFDIEMEYPFLGRLALDTQIRQWVDDKYYETGEEMHSICAGMPDEGHRPYEYKLGYDVFNTPGTVSVIFKSWAYTGGAHGQEGIQSVVLNAKNGNRLGYNDIFASTSGLYEFLSDYVYSALRPKLGSIWQDSPMFADGLAPIEESFKNFAVTATGISIYFPRYQIAPYSEGVQRCEIPLTDLVKFLPRPEIWQ